MCFLLGEEGGHAGFLVLGVETLAEHAAFEGDGLVGRQVVLFIDALFGIAYGNRGVFDDAFGKTHGFLHQLFGLIDGVDQSDAQRFIRFDGAAGENQLLGNAHAGDFGQAVSSGKTGDDLSVYRG